MVAAAAINVSTAIAVSLTAGTAAVTTDAEEISSAPATETIFKNLERFYGWGKSFWIFSGFIELILDPVSKVICWSSSW